MAKLKFMIGKRKKQEERTKEESYFLNDDKEYKKRIMPMRI